MARVRRPGDYGRPDDASRAEQRKAQEMKEG
jgi:hypothetical protein